MKKFLIFQDMEISCPKIKKISGGNFPTSKNKEKHSEKISYILGNGSF